MGSPLAGYSGTVYITSTPNVALTNEALTDAGDHKTFSEPTASKRYWDQSAAFVVQTTTDGVTWTTASPGTYTIRFVSGQVVLQTALTGSAPGCRISSGAYLPVSVLGNCTDWEATPATDLLDSSSLAGYGGSRFKTYLPALQGATVKINKFWVDSTFWALIQSGAANLLVASMWTGANSTGNRWEGYASVKGDDIKTDIKALITEGLDLQVTGQFYYFAS